MARISPFCGFSTMITPPSFTLVLSIPTEAL